MSGAQIGGVIGGIVGTFFGMPQVGYALGAAIGGYVDPVRTHGPRIGDSSAQTSSVGGVIPFGFGTFTTAGNLIWRDPKLREQAKHQRQGKGGGVKSTTYTYTRSYAIGICRGPIYGVKWIKRNGKKVYTTDPAATQEEKQASAKFAAKLKIYLGTETQMPDPTIVAVEGMANVPGHRGLAYIVVEHDDLTDLGGAVPQYEFCVQASPPEAYLTSIPYPVSGRECVGLSSRPVAGQLRTLVIERQNWETVGVSVVPVMGELRDRYVKRPVWDSMGLTVTPVGGQLKSVKVDYEDREITGVTASPIGGRLKEVLITIDSDEAVGFSIRATGGRLQ